MIEIGRNRIFMLWLLPSALSSTWPSARGDPPEQEAADEGRNGGSRDGVVLRLRLGLVGGRARAERLLLLGVRVLGVLDALLRARLDVCLRCQRGSGVAEVPARVLDLAPDLVRALLHVHWCRADLALVLT